MDEEDPTLTTEIHINPLDELSPVDFRDMYTYMKDEKNKARGQTDGLE